MPLRNNKLAACVDRTLVATFAPPAKRSAATSGPVLAGKKVWPDAPLLTWPFCATMKNVNTGGLLAAQADRSGKLSRNGKPTATPPAPVRNARRLSPRRFLGLS